MHMQRQLNVCAARLSAGKHGSNGQAVLYRSGTNVLTGTVPCRLQKAAFVAQCSGLSSELDSLQTGRVLPVQLHAGSVLKVVNLLIEQAQHAFQTSAL